MSEAIRQGDIPGVQLRYRHRLAVPPERIWPWLTDARRLADWLGAVEIQADGAWLVLDPDSEAAAGGRHVRERIATLEQEPGRRWRASLQRLESGWQAATELVVEVSPADTGCELMVFQGGFESLSLSICLPEWERYRRRWRRACARLETALAGRGVVETG